MNPGTVQMPRKQAISGDAAQVRALLAWAKAEGIALAHVTVGTCHVELATVAPAVNGPQRPRTDGRESIYRQFGGPLLTELGLPGTSEGDGVGDLQPVVRAQ